MSAGCTIQYSGTPACSYSRSFSRWSLASGFGGKDLDHQIGRALAPAVIELRRIADNG